MRRLIIRFLSATIVVACTKSHGVGAPIPGAPSASAHAATDAGAPLRLRPVSGSPRPVGAACLPSAVPVGGYLESEIGFETGVPACGGGVCIVYELAGDPAPGCVGPGCADPIEVERRAFCSCRCEGPPDAVGAVCPCPGGFRCEPLLATGGPEIAGSYCVRAFL